MEMSEVTDLCCSFLQPEEKQRATQQFTKLQAAMKVLGVSGEEQKALWLILGAVYHLGAAGATKGRSSLPNTCLDLTVESSLVFWRDILILGAPFF